MIEELLGVLDLTRPLTARRQPHKDQVNLIGKYKESLASYQILVEKTAKAA
jgi:hypothetical protein